MSCPGFELLTDPTGGAVSVIRFTSREIFRLFAQRCLRPRGKGEYGMIYGRAEFGGTGEDVIVLPDLHFPELHFHSGKANAAAFIAFLLELSAEASPHVCSAYEKRLRLWDGCFRRAFSNRAIEYLLKVRPGPDDNGGTASSPGIFDLEGYEFLRPLRVVLAGEPNAGKSSLFNRLLGEGRALVSPSAGTTRDPVSAQVEISGHEVELVDSAGVSAEGAGQLRGAGSGAKVRMEAETLSREAVRDADLVLLLGSDPGLRVAAGKTVLITPKSDLDPPLVPGSIRVSSKTGEGLAELSQILSSRVEELRNGTVSPKFCEDEDCELTRSS